MLTGASSFTGVWFAEALAADGWEVVAPLLRHRDAYSGIRADRVERLSRVAKVEFNCGFGTPAMLELIAAGGPIHVFGHHAAKIDGYRHPDFDFIAAVQENIHNGGQVFAALKRASCRGVLLTGTVFEAGEGGADLPAVTSYGLSKSLTRTVLEAWADEVGLDFGAFIIPSPYGIGEEPRFPWYLFRTWFDGRAAVVRTPYVVRDHIAVPQLAKAYSQSAQRILSGEAHRFVVRPSGWIATQSDFAKRLAAQARDRLMLSCPLELLDQTISDEPYCRVNSDAVGPFEDEDEFWDKYIAWYAELQAAGRLQLA